MPRFLSFGKRGWLLGNADIPAQVSKAIIPAVLRGNSCSRSHRLLKPVLSQCCLEPLKAKRRRLSTSHCWAGDEHILWTRYKHCLPQEHRYRGNVSRRLRGAWSCCAISIGPYTPEPACWQHGCRIDRHRHLKHAWFPMRYSDVRPDSFRPGLLRGAGRAAMYDATGSSTCSVPQEVKLLDLRRHEMIHAMYISLGASSSATVR